MEDKVFFSVFFFVFIFFLHYIYSMLVLVSKILNRSLNFNGKVILLIYCIRRTSTEWKHLFIKNKKKIPKCYSTFAAEKYKIYAKLFLTINRLMHWAINYFYTNFLLNRSIWKLYIERARVISFYMIISSSLPFVVSAEYYYHRMFVYFFLSHGIKYIVWRVSFEYVWHFFSPYLSKHTKRVFKWWNRHDQCNGFMLLWNYSL